MPIAFWGVWNKVLVVLVLLLLVLLPPPDDERVADTDGTTAAAVAEPCCCRGRGAAIGVTMGANTDADVGATFLPSSSCASLSSVFVASGS